MKTLKQIINENGEFLDTSGTPAESFTKVLDAIKIDYLHQVKFRHPEELVYHIQRKQDGLYVTAYIHSKSWNEEELFVKGWIKNERMP